MDELQFLNKFVELHLFEKQPGALGENSVKPQDESIGTSSVAKIKAKIQFVDEHSIGLTYNSTTSETTDYEAYLAFVDVYDGPDVIASFDSTVTKHWADPENQKGTLYLRFPESIQTQVFPAAERHKIRIPASMHIVSKSSQILPQEIRGRIIPVVIRDISETGAQIVSELKLSKFFRVSLKFDLEGERFEVLAEIVWAETADKFYIYGLRFLNADFITVKAIRALSFSVVHRVAKE